MTCCIEEFVDRLSGGQHPIKKIKEVKMNYKIIENCEQGSEAWLALRKTKITATDTGVILGLNPWKTPLMLWEEKLGLREPQAVTEKMREGSLMEDQARDFINRMYKHSSPFLPVVLESTEYPFMMASLDGMEKNGAIIEIKCGKGSHDLAKQGIIPDYYMTQCQKQMFVSGQNCMAYVSYRGDDDYKSIFVNRDNEFIEKMIEAETEFYRCLMELTPPPATDKDFVSKDDEDWNEISYRWKCAKKRLKSEEEAELELRNLLISMCDGQSSQGAGVRISKSLRRGNVDYACIPELKSVNLDAYRKKTTEFYRISQNDI